MLKNKNVIITGSNRGIGHAILKLFAQNRANIWACTRSENSVFQEELQKLSKENKVKIKNINFDLNDISQVKDSAKQILNEVNKIDVLINNAGIIDTSLFQMTKIEKIKQIFDINFFSQLEFTQIIIKKMLKNKGSSIINISSTAALDPVKGRIAYSASKSALISFSQILSKELSKFNIRVNVIAPGLVDTDLMHESHSEEIINTVLRNTSVNRLGQASEIANLALFLASDLSSYINGQVIRIDGGM